MSYYRNPKLKALFISVPILFTFLLVLLFYLFYLRRRQPSLRLRINSNSPGLLDELGLRKEVREMLPVIIYMESFSIQDTLCSVCLGEYEASDKLQQIPACRHAFHMDCIDHWLATHTTCPICRYQITNGTKSTG